MLETYGKAHDNSKNQKNFEGHIIPNYSLVNIVPSDGVHSCWRHICGTSRGTKGLDEAQLPDALSFVSSE